MQPRELEEQVFSHRVVTENGFEKIIPADLDIHMRGRVLTILEARSIIGALAGISLDRVDIPMFNPAHAASPAEQKISKTVQPERQDETKPANYDPAMAAIEAARSTADLNRQFATAGQL